MHKCWEVMLEMATSEVILKGRDTVLIYHLLQEKTNSVFSILCPFLIPILVGSCWYTISRVIKGNVWGICNANLGAEQP